MRGKPVGSFWKRDYNRMAQSRVRRLRKLAAEDGDLFGPLPALVEHAVEIDAVWPHDTIKLLEDIGRKATSIAGAMKGAKV